jgi:hypothetical protein
MTDRKSISKNERWAKLSLKVEDDAMTQKPKDGQNYPRKPNVPLTPQNGKSEQKSMRFASFY